MGRIKTKLIKRISEDLVKFHHDKLSKTYADNSKVVPSLLNMPTSKKIRNSIAGYITRLLQRAE
ncbi:30S ribosomal protein S17e [Candidatus Woesearchaeota archaeon]|nr:30S ribosomal protein S17e [Candidatus Woesearchaeota archaeon]